MKIWKVLVVTFALAIPGGAAIAQDDSSIDNKSVSESAGWLANNIKPEDSQGHICFWFNGQWVCF